MSTTPFSAALRLCVSLVVLATLCSAAIPDPDAAATVVLYNDAESASVSLAGYYAEKRGIPLDHLVGLQCPLEESISRADYERTVAEPLRNIFLARGWWKTEADLVNGRVGESSIRYVAVMRGIPLKIAAVPLWEGDQTASLPALLQHNEAAFDSELAVLGLHTRQITGTLPNPCFQERLLPGQPKVPWLLRVCRLDAAEPATVRRMIDDAVATEKNGLWGFAYVDSRGLTGGPHLEGDVWMRRVAADAASHGMPCIHDNGPALFPESYPINRAALYFGWYCGEVQGAFKNNHVRFLPGAIAVHLHSFSAESLRAPLRGWCAPLLEMGAAATLGNVYEPYLTLTTHLDEFERRLRAGSTFADAAYAAQPVLSWMATFIGDPLYRPFKASANRMPADYAAYREGAMLWAQKGRAAGEPVLQAKGRALKSGVVFEGLGLLQAAAKEPEAALASWVQARHFYKEEADGIRCALHAIALLRAEGQTGPALALTREEIRRFPRAEATAHLRAIELELALPTPTPAPHATR
ncbi:MAG: TIGR03790 family protein [Verrucomicrobia bacterium]|nr:TIGR03790 family protein [Verrucomicrobiota bacterium]